MTQDVFLETNFHLEGLEVNISTWNDTVLYDQKCTATIYLR